MQVTYIISYFSLNVKYFSQFNQNSKDFCSFTEGVSYIVARGPVPRDRWIDRSMARDRPSPYGKGSRSGYRSAGALGCHTRIRAGFPRERRSEGETFFFVARRALDYADAGEGQALALR